MGRRNHSLQLQSRLIDRSDKVTRLILSVAVILTKCVNLLYRFRNSDSDHRPEEAAPHQ